MKASPWKVLIVDDEPNNLKLLGQILKDNYTLFFATDGKKALEILKKIKPDMILLDIMMPGMDGYETCKRIKSYPDTAKIPVIFISALEEVADEHRGFEMGGVDYIRKPVSPPHCPSQGRHSSGAL